MINILRPNLACRDSLAMMSALSVSHPMAVAGAVAVGVIGLTTWLLVKGTCSWLVPIWRCSFVLSLALHRVEPRE